MRVRIFLMLLLLLPAAFLAGLFLAPNGEELALMQLGDLDFSKSFKLYDDLHSKGNNSIGVVSPLVNLHLHYGEVDEAIDLLASYVADKPRDVEARKQLAELYKASQRYYEYCQVLEELQVLAPSKDVLSELVEEYGFLGDYKKETNALALLIERKDYEPHEEDYVELAALYRAKGDQKAAIGVMEKLLDKKNYKVSFDAATLAVQLTLEGGDESRASEIVGSFLKSHSGEEYAIKFSEVFEKNGKIDLAYKTLVPFLSDGENSPQLEEHRIALLFTQKKIDQVFAILSKLFAQNRLPEALAATLIDLAQNRKDYALMEAVLRKVDLNEIPEEALLRYAGVCVRLNRHDLAQFMESRIAPGNLKKDMPLLAAILRVGVDDTPQSLSALMSLPKDAFALPEERLMAAAIFVTRGQSGRARELLGDMPVADVLRELDAAQYARLYLEDADPETEAKAAQRLQRIQGGNPSTEVRAAADKALLLIQTGRGEIDSVALWFKAHSGQDTELYAEAYDIAQHTHHEKLALNFAERLYRAEPTPLNREQLIECLAASGRYHEALTYLEEEVGSNANAKISACADILSKWAHNSDVAENHAKMQPHVDFMLKHMERGEKEQREAAFLLQEMGFLAKAEGLFVNLADNKPFSSKEVKEILSFWDDHPSPAALAWIAKRAGGATGEEKAQWLAHLNAINHPEVVLSALDDKIEGAPSSLVDVYLDALVQTHSPKLGEALTNAIENETQAARLKHLVKLSEQEDIQGIQDKAWRKLFALDPDDADALKSVALQEAAANHYSAALPLLERYLKDNPDDYRINYAYAGILQHKQKKEDAKQYYDKAYSQLIELKEKTLSDQISEAHLLYAEKRLSESEAVFNELIEKYPDNKALRADFAVILLENKQYDEASVVLSR